MENTLRYADGTPLPEFTSIRGRHDQRGYQIRNTYRNLDDALDDARRWAHQWGENWAIVISRGETLESHNLRTIAIGGIR